ncbi:hypothetical protein NUW54_g4694 [Trametes sanguinea]|uniref:Uncharacterized protein n=1 Tax=Trametes sanguinea TaxID=158606 RepID=A0ACC1PX73_9APHY|nr:hypothetical protein NUW54_g4694 [Trametes sanguinea]
MPPRGRPKKRKFNTTGLVQNQNNACEQQHSAAEAHEGEAVPGASRPSSLAEAQEDSGDLKEGAGLEAANEPEEESGWELVLSHDSLKLVPAEMDILESEGSGCEEESEDEETRSNVLLEAMLAHAARIEDAFEDEDWMPAADLRAMKHRAVLRKERPKTYSKGPDVGSKSARTQRRYKALLANQTQLDRFFPAISPSMPSRPPAPSTECHGGPLGSEPTSSQTASSQVPEPVTSPTFLPSCTPLSPALLPPRAPSPTPALLLPTPALSPARTSDSSLQVARRGGTSPPTTDPKSFGSAGASDLNAPTSSLAASRRSSSSLCPSASEPQGSSEDEWEEEVSSTLQLGTKIRGWDVLRAQVKQDLADKAQQLPISRVNQLCIIRNFATLRLKGKGRIAASLEIAQQWQERVGSEAYFARRVRTLARHYQIFEQLPVETRGGKSNAHSHLHNESVQAAARDWLTAQPSGTITPRAFQASLNETILPTLIISLPRPICERTARRWLIQLGWRRTVLRKGVYMDGHERPDVVEYRQDTFLPLMAEYERRMCRYEPTEDGTLRCIKPVLVAGETEVIAIFHDECCFHANDFKKTAWLREGETVRQSKSRGRLIHVSDFITEATGRLVLRDESSGSILEDARVIIYPGSNGDAWRTLAARHCSYSTNLLLTLRSPPDALRAFDMNKSNGGKQRKQRDTVIPDSNPTEALRGRPQKMTLPNGDAKGLQQVLEERGFDVHKLRAKCSPVCPFESTGCCMARLLSQQDDFKNQKSMLELVIEKAGHACIFLPKFHCELNPIEMYWGWCKYRYREVIKKNFEEAKQLAHRVLDSCPTDVIRRFINKSWRFMSAYRKGLTGQAAAWAVRKQKQHRQVSRIAMMHLDAILN